MTTGNANFNPFYYSSSDARLLLSKLNVALSSRVQLIVAVAATIFVAFSLGFLCKKLPTFNLLNIFRSHPSNRSGNRQRRASVDSKNCIGCSPSPKRPDSICSIARTSLEVNPPRQFSLSIPRDDSAPGPQVAVVGRKKNLVVLDESGVVIARFFENSEIQIGTFNEVGDLTNGIEVDRTQTQNFSRVIVSRNVYDEKGLFVTYDGAGVIIDFETKQTVLTTLNEKGENHRRVAFDPVNNTIITTDEKGTERTWSLKHGVIQAEQFFS